MLWVNAAGFGPSVRPFLPGTGIQPGASESSSGKEPRARGKQPAARELARPGKVWAEVPVFLDLEQGLEAESPISPFGMSMGLGQGVSRSCHN